MLRNYLAVHSIFVKLTVPVDVLLARLFQGQLGIAPVPAAPLTDDLRA
jgi:hypothetical protein